jgi:hypothetical protein
LSVRLDEVAGRERVTAEDRDDRVHIACPIHRSELAFAAAAAERAEQLVPRRLEPPAADGGASDEFGCAAASI